MLDAFSEELEKIAARPGLMLKPSKENPRVRRWQRITPKQTEPKKHRYVQMGMVGLSTALIGMGTASALRGRTLRGLEKAAPKVITQSKDDFISLMKPGDVILIQTKAHKKITARTTDAIFRRAQGDWVHSGIYVGNGKMAHTTPRAPGHAGGVEDIKKWFLDKGYNVLVVRPKGTGQHVADIATRTAGQYRYQRHLPVFVGAGDLLPSAIARRLYKIKEGKVICAGMTADILQKGGVMLPKEPGRMITLDFRRMVDAPVIRFKAERDVITTSPIQGTGFLIPGFALGGTSLAMKKTAARGELTRHVLRKAGLRRLADWQHRMRGKMVEKVLKPLPKVPRTRRALRLLEKHPEMAPSPGFRRKVMARKRVKLMLEAPEINPAFLAAPGTLWYPALREATAVATKGTKYSSLGELARHVPLVRKIRRALKQAPKRLKTPPKLIGAKPGTG